MQDLQIHQIRRTPKGQLGVRLLKDEINDLPLTRWEGPVHVISTESELCQALESLRTTDVLGFDTETRPAFRKGQSYPPSLMQLATEHEVFLFKLQQLGIPGSLAALLSDRQMKKVGVAVKFDAEQLQQVANFRPQGFIDLADISKKLSMRHHGLRGLAAVLLGVRISKTVRTTNWSDPHLTEKQIRYAATDAWISRLLYMKLTDIRKKQQSTAHYDS
ncbi:3'-5' exonuclease [Desulfogranum japonicum]|uniref:3'-5' exonuclease n=1 Tax=Desulfogranum japonicum TaxID=231447 RepID=UPI0004242BB9|nr:3'-5' exonuclease [Desulfogranum japonicum]